MYPMAHLLVADAYAQGRPALLADAAYFLGAIAPDAIHMRKGTALGIGKFDTHLKARGADGLSEVMAYWYETGRTPFDIGYGVHVITDRLWINFYRRAYPALMAPNGSTRAECYRPDAEWIDRALYWSRGRGWEVLAKLRTVAAPRIHPLLTAEEIEGWRDAVIEGFDQIQSHPSGAPAVMALDGVERFIKEAGERLSALIP